jgi:hypothetical protein
MKLGLCPYYSSCGLPYYQERCLNNYEKCTIYLRTEQLRNNTNKKELSDKLEIKNNNEMSSM